MKSLFLFLALALSCFADEGQKLHALFDAEWEHTMEHSPTWASQLGDRRWNDRWPDGSLAAIESEHARDQEVLTQLTKMDRAALSPADRLNFDMFRLNYEQSLEGFRFARHLIALDQRGGIQTEDELASALRFETVKDYEDWIARLRGFGAYMDQTIALLREGVRRGMVQPKVTMQRVPAQIEKQIVAAPEQSPFFKPLQQFGGNISAADRERLTAAGRAAVAESVLPAYARFKKFFADEYLPACLDGIGAWRLPDGDARYAFLARSFTTTNLTPKGIHEIGLAEVARIRGEMEKVKEQAGFTGTLAEFFAFLRTDRRFYCAEEKQLLTEYLATAKRIDPLLVKLFRSLPRTPYGVEAIPAKIAPDTSAGYYRQPAADGSRAGTFFVNTYKPESRPRWEMMALSLHESVPGHHLQIALAQEQGDLPHFRQHGGYTAYVEGWALYGESLGDELGLYDDPYSKFGQLTYEMWRAVRLVVDTGIHAFHWDRDKAITFFRENAPKSELDIVNEVDRYISWPGQALAYKVGQLKIKELRARATTQLGDRFDVKEFHDIVLLGGAMPLSLLEQRVDEWLRGKEQQKGERGAKLPIKTHDERTIAGWTVHVNVKLIEEEAAALEKALPLLQAQLDAIIRLVPAKAVAELQKVPLWINPEYPNQRARAEYHPGADWLRDNGRDPVMAKGVEFTNVRIFEAETRRMPNFALHELAHAYHDRVLGFENAEIEAAYQKAKASGKYDKVLRQDSEGRTQLEKAYAMTNAKEYFAECTEAFFARNDFFPFTHEELKQHDPEMLGLLEKVWGVELEKKR